MLFFGVCFFLYFIKLSAGNGFCVNNHSQFCLNALMHIITAYNYICRTARVKLPEY